MRAPSATLFSYGLKLTKKQEEASHGGHGGHGGIGSSIWASPDESTYLSPPNFAEALGQALNAWYTAKKSSVNSVTSVGDLNETVSWHK